MSIDNGNVFVFCDFVLDTMGCVRGAGHNGPHALSLQPYPQGPIILIELGVATLPARLRRHAADVISRGGTNASQLRADLQAAADLIDQSQTGTP
jgi:hypothetical protein